MLGEWIKTNIGTELNVMQFSTQYDLNHEIGLLFPDNLNKNLNVWANVIGMSSENFRLYYITGHIRVRKCT